MTQPLNIWRKHTCLNQVFPHLPHVDSPVSLEPQSLAYHQATNQLNIALLSEISKLIKHFSWETIGGSMARKIAILLALQETQTSVNKSNEERTQAEGLLKSYLLGAFPVLAAYTTCPNPLPPSEATANYLSLVKEVCHSDTFDSHTPSENLVELYTQLSGSTHKLPSLSSKPPQTPTLHPDTTIPQIELLHILSLLISQLKLLGMTEAQWTKLWDTPPATPSDNLPPIILFYRIPTFLYTWFSPDTPNYATRAIAEWIVMAKTCGLSKDDIGQHLLEHENTTH